MGGGYDGSVRIDTRLDARGFDQGMRGIANSLKGLLAAVGVAFGVGQVIAFGKTAVDAAAQLAGSLTGLQSVLDGQGRSFAQAQGFIDAYTRDGLIPATNAIKSYQNLALRGYSDEQISTTLTALKDASAFGRRASLSMGEAVQTASEGLRNENSILVDNAGVTKNVARMWEDYARSIGTTAANLTQAQKVQAEVNGILEETKFQTGDAAKLAGSYAGGVAGLATSFYNLRVAVGNALMPILAQIIPYIKAVVDWFVVLFNTAARVIGLFFGVQAAAGATADTAGGLAQNVDSAAGAAGDLADNTKKAGKAAKGALASFDELNVLASEAGTGTGTGGVGGGVPVDPGITIGDPREIIPDALAEKVAAFKTQLMELLTPASEAFGRLREALGGLGSTVWEGLKWAWENILVPLGEWVITDAAPAFFDLLAAAANVLNEALIALQPMGVWLWENFLQPVAAWTGGEIVKILGWLTDRLNDLSKWIKENPTAFQNIAIVIGVLAAALFLAATATAVWTAVVGVATAVGTAFGAVMAFITSPVTLVILAIAALIIIIVLLIKNWDWVKAKAGEVWDWIKQKWGEAGGWFNANVGEPVKNAFKTALEWIDEKWRSTWGGIKDFVKNTVNSIIDFVNGMISAVAGGINTVIGAINSIRVTIPEWVPGLGGQSWGLSIPTVPTPQIPRLATGAVIPANSEFLAVLGDQRHGTNIEAPADLIRQLFREEMAERGGEEITIRFEGELAPLVRTLMPVIERERKRRGASLITSGSVA